MTIVYGSAIFSVAEDVTKANYKDFVPAALESGQFKLAPEPTVLGDGLDQLETGLNTLKKGVSASKLIVVV
jgi:hypothetical protein